MFQIPFLSGIRLLFKKYHAYKRLSRAHFSADYFKDTPYKFGKYTYGIPTITQYNDCKLSVGNFCSIAQECRILLGGEHFTNTVSLYNWDEARENFATVHSVSTCSKGDTIIGNDVWIGRNVTILSGVHIGDGAVIGAGAVVSKDIPPYAVAVGNPIRILRYRFDGDVIAALLQIAWWNWDDKKINEMLPLILSENPEIFIRTCLGNDWRNAIQK